MPAVYIADGYYRRCRLLPLLPLLSLLSLLSPMPMRLVRCLLGELDAAGHADALETLLLLSSDEVAADVELDQRPVVEHADSGFNAAVLIKEVVGNVQARDLARSNCRA